VAKETKEHLTNLNNIPKAVTQTEEVLYKVVPKVYSDGIIFRFEGKSNEIV
jgi:hypothetical protein